jgi:hypothetical protein
MLHFKITLYTKPHLNYLSYMTWNNVTVFQYQQINEIYANAKDLSDLDLSVKVTSILKNLTEHQIDSLPVKELGPLLESISFVHTDIQPQAVDLIKVNGRVYRCIYDVRNMPAARYIESKHFSSDVMGNLHKIFACMVIPQKKTWFGWKDDKYDASRHSEYAQDILEAPVVNVLGSVVFFYQVYRLWIKNSKAYLVQQMMKGGVTEKKAVEGWEALCSIMDGFIKPNWLPTLKESHLTKHLTYLS